MGPQIFCASLRQTQTEREREKEISLRLTFTFSMREKYFTYSIDKID